MATSKRGGGTPQKPPEGVIRLSQVVTTFGPGAMVDLLDHAVLVGGLDFWRYDKHKAPGFIDEPRLRDAVAEKLRSLGVDLDDSAAFRLPPAGDDSAPSKFNGIPVIEFPSWFVCQECGALTRSTNLEKKKDRYVHQCGRKKVGTCVPVRFVTTCKRGHLEEFPWVRFVHANAKERCGAPDLYLKEDASGDFSRIVVECRACDAKRKLSEGQEPKVMPRCRGERPWLGPEGDEEEGCEEHLNLLVRTASSAYFSQVMSALSIPDSSRELLDKVCRADVWKILQVASADNLSNFLQIPDVNAAVAGYEPDDILRAVDLVKAGQTPERDPLRTAEYKVFLKAGDEVPGELPPKDAQFFASRLTTTEKVPPKVERIVLAKKLRQVRAQIGLTRLSATTPNLQGDIDDASQLQPLGLTTTWLPASEVYGEGVLLRLDEGAVRAWESLAVVKDRAAKLEEGYDREFAEKHRPPFPGVRFYLLHTLSHLLMSSIALECGYSAAALSERIYCAGAGEDVPMAAILILTGTSGAEGTLGGLVEQGRHMTRHLRRAWDSSGLCSNDPVCSHHLPADPSRRYLEGAACHGCLFVAEPACERFNRYLDRALVVPALGLPAELAFYPERP